MRVLMIEDNETFAAVVTERFLSAHTVTVIATLGDALRAPTDGFDAVLVDYDLPDGKGDTVVRALRNEAPGALIIAISSHALGNEALIAAGADAECPKHAFDQIDAVIQASARSRV